MGIKRKVGACWLCGKVKSITKCYGHDICPTCTMLIGTVKNNPQLVIKAMEEYGTLVKADVSAVDAAALAAAVKKIEELREEISRRQTQNEQLCDDIVKLQASESVLRDDVARLRADTGGGSANGIEETLAAVSAERDDLVARLRQAETACYPSLPLSIDVCRLDAIAWQIARGMATRERVDFQWDDVEYLRGLSGAVAQ